MRSTARPVSGFNFLFFSLNVLLLDLPWLEPWTEHAVRPAGNALREDFTFRHSFSTEVAKLLKASPGQIVIVHPEKFRSKYEPASQKLSVKVQHPFYLFLFLFASVSLVMKLESVWFVSLKTRGSCRVLKSLKYHFYFLFILFVHFDFHFFISILGLKSKKCPDFHPVSKFIMSCLNFFTFYHSREALAA